MNKKTLSEIPKIELVRAVEGFLIIGEFHFNFALFFIIQCLLQKFHEISFIRCPLKS